MKTTLPVKITSIDEAKAYLSELYNNDESYHPEDDAADCLSDLPEGQAPTKEESDHMNELMNQIYALAKGTDFDPCEYSLMLDPDYVAELAKRKANGE